MEIRERENGTKEFTFHPDVFPVNCFLIQEENYLTLVDAAMEDTTVELIDYLKKQALPLKNIVFTHGHDDHTGDLTLLKETFPEAIFYLSTIEYEYVKNRKIPTIIDWPFQPNQLLNEGDQIGSLTVVETPGHTPGSISLLDERCKVLFVGDVLQTQGGLAIAGDLRPTFPKPAKSTVNFAENIQTVERIVSMAIRKIYCGHGLPIENPQENLPLIIERAKKTLVEQ